MSAKTEAVMAYLLLVAAGVAISALTGGAWSLAALAAACITGGRAGTLIGASTPPPPERGYMGLPGPMGPKGDQGPTGSPGMTAAEWEAVMDRRAKAVDEMTRRDDDK